MTVDDQRSHYSRKKNNRRSMVLVIPPAQHGAIFEHTQSEMITQTIKPDVAIVTDVCHDTSTPMIDPKKQGDNTIGKGPVISYAPAVQQLLRDRIIDTAEAKKIPFQRLASSRYTGTDTDAFAYSNGGVPSALISLPLKYMHTTVEMVHQEDVENVIKLIYETLQTVKNGEKFSYFS